MNAIAWTVVMQGTDPSQRSRFPARCVFVVSIEGERQGRPYGVRAAAAARDHEASVSTDSFISRIVAGDDARADRDVDQRQDRSLARAEGECDDEPSDPSGD